MPVEVVRMAEMILKHRPSPEVVVIRVDGKEVLRSTPEEAMDLSRRMEECAQADGPGRHDDVPTWEEMLVARSWIQAGCPSAHRDHDPKAAVAVLWKLMEGLPHHLAIYAWGSDEWRAERVRLRDLEAKAGDPETAK